MAGASLSDDTDHSQTEVEYNPLWLELRQSKNLFRAGYS